MQKALTFRFSLEMAAAKSHRFVVKVYGDTALSETTCGSSFGRFKDANLNLSDKKHKSRPRKANDLQALLDEDDSQLQTKPLNQIDLAERAIFMRFQAVGKLQNV